VYGTCIVCVGAHMGSSTSRCFAQLVLLHPPTYSALEELDTSNSRTDDRDLCHLCVCEQADSIRRQAIDIFFIVTPVLLFLLLSFID